MIKARWILLLMVLSLVGCYDETEGCLDPAAINFDVSADKDCCCEYPKLKLTVGYKENDSTSFQKMHYFEDLGDDVYKIESFAFFLSHLEVKGEPGIWVDVADSTEYWVYDVLGMPEKAFVSNNAILVQNNVLKYDFGGFGDFGSFDSVRFKIGLDEQQQLIIPDSLPSEHVFGIGQDSMWVGPKEYLQQKWVIQTDTANYTVDTFSISGEILPLDLGYTSAFFVAKGKDYNLELDVTIPTWLKGIDWQWDKAKILDTLRNNSKFAISLVQ